MNSSLQSKIYLFGDSFIHGSGGDITSDGKLKGIGYYLEKENIEVHDYSVQGSSNQSTFDYLESTISNSEVDMCVVVGITFMFLHNGVEIMLIIKLRETILQLVLMKQMRC